MKNIEYEPKFVELSNVPSRHFTATSVWRDRLNALPLNKAGMLEFNNRQRAHQVASSLRQAGRYHKIPLRTRIIRGDIAIHGTNNWLLYF